MYAFHLNNRVKRESNVDPWDLGVTGLKHRSKLIVTCGLIWLGFVFMDLDKKCLKVKRKEDKASSIGLTFSTLV